MTAERAVLAIFHHDEAMADAVVEGLDEFHDARVFQLSQRVDFPLNSCRVPSSRIDLKLESSEYGIPDHGSNLNEKAPFSQRKFLPL